MNGLHFSKKFKKDYEKMKSNSCFKINELEKIFYALRNNESLEIKYRNHKLRNYSVSSKIKFEIKETI